jgi:hypothetical protein
MGFLLVDGRDCGPRKVKEHFLKIKRRNGAGPPRGSWILWMTSMIYLLTLRTYVAVSGRVDLLKVIGSGMEETISRSL